MKKIIVLVLSILAVITLVGCADKTISLPDVIGMTLEEAQALCKDIDWDAMHMVNTITYETVWDLVVEGKEAVTEQEKVLFENMKNQKKYFSRFKNKDEYVIHNCAYWNYFSNISTSKMSPFQLGTISNLQSAP